MDDIVSSVKKFYDEVGLHFSRTRQKTYGGHSSNWIVTDKYLSLLKAGQSVLDIGCGNGKLVSGLIEGVEYLGTDFSQTLLSEARNLRPGHTFVYGDVLDSNHWKAIGAYNAIFCVAVLHHIPKHSQQQYMLREMKKHIKPGGFLYLTVWNMWQDKFLPYHVGDHVKVPYNKLWRRYFVPFTIESMTELMLESGWKIDEIYLANLAGEKVDIKNGQNLVVVAS